MTTKVKVPRQVAEAIESIKSTPYGQAYNIDTILSNGVHTPESHYGTIKRWITRDGRVNGIPEYFAALVNGYEVEKSPEDKIRSYYNDAVKHSKEAKYPEGKSIAIGRITAIRQTINYLGIKIEGVNA